MYFMTMGVPSRRCLNHVVFTRRLNMLGLLQRPRHPATLREDDGISQSQLQKDCVEENTWEHMDPEAVSGGERAGPGRFRNMGVYEYVDRRESRGDLEGSVVKVKWLRIHKGCACT